MQPPARGAETLAFDFRIHMEGIRRTFGFGRGESAHPCLHHGHIPRSPRCLTAWLRHSRNSWDNLCYTAGTGIIPPSSEGASGRYRPPPAGSEHFCSHATPAATSSGETGTARQQQEHQPRMRGSAARRLSAKVWRRGDEKCLLPAEKRSRWDSPLCADGQLGQCQQDGALPVGARIRFGMEACTALSVGKTAPLTWPGLGGALPAGSERVPHGNAAKYDGRRSRMRFQACAPVSLARGCSRARACFPRRGSQAGGAATCCVLARSSTLLPMTPNKCRFAACLCANSAWRESFIATIVTLFCKFSFAVSRYSIPAEWELCLVTSQLILVPSVFSLLKYNALHLIKNFTSLIASLNVCCPVSYRVPRSSTSSNTEVTLCIKLELGSSLSWTVVLRETDVEHKYSVKKPAFVPVIVLKRSLFNSKTSFWQLHIQFLNTFCCFFNLKANVCTLFSESLWKPMAHLPGCGEHLPCSSCCRQFLCEPLFAAISPERPKHRREMLTGQKTLTMHKIILNIKIKQA